MTTRTPARRTARRAAALLALTSASAVVGASGATSHAALGLDDGRVVHYTFTSFAGGVLPDRSGLGNHGTLVNFPAAPPTALNHSGGARVLVFDRDRQQRIDVGNVDHQSTAPSLKLQRYTVASWIDITEDDTSQQNWEVAEKADTFWLNVRNGNDSTDNHADADDPHFVLRCGSFFDVAGGVYSRRLTGTTVIPHGVTGHRWTHVACTYDGATMTLYVDGAVEAQERIGWPLHTGDAALVVGGNDKTQWAPDYYHNWWEGSLDDFRLYDRALSADEMARLVRLTTPDNAPTVTFTWPVAGAVVSGRVPLRARAVDENPGLRVTFSYRPALATGWTRIATDSTAPNPYTAGWDTTALAPGRYVVQAVAQDSTGHRAATTRAVTVQRPG